MLVLSRKTGQSIEIGNGITVTVTQIKGKQVRIGIDAPAEVPIHRHELTVKRDRACGILPYGGTTGEPVTASFYAS